MLSRLDAFKAVVYGRIFSQKSSFAYLTGRRKSKFPTVSNDTLAQMKILNTVIPKVGNKVKFSL